MPMLRKVKDIAERPASNARCPWSREWDAESEHALCARAKPESRIIGNTAMFVKTGLFFWSDEVILDD